MTEKLYVDAEMRLTIGGKNFVNAGSAISMAETGYGSGGYVCLSISLGRRAFVIRKSCHRYADRNSAANGEIAKRLV